MVKSLSISHKLIELVKTSNPFHYMGPVPNKEFFFDREKELDTAIVVIKQVLKGSVGGVLVQGGRGSGKTSFLEELQRRLDDEKIANTYIPLDSEMVKEGSEIILFNTIIQELIKSCHRAKIIEQGTYAKFLSFLRRIGKIEGIEVEFPGFNLIVNREAAKTQFSYIVLRDGLKDFLKLIEKEGKKGISLGAVLLLDEGDALTLNKKLLYIIRNAFQKVRKIGLVIAGSTKLSEEVGIVFSPVPRFFRKIELGPFPNDEVVGRAINVPLEINRKNLLMNNQIRLETHHSGFDRRLKEVAGRIPLHINMLCHFAFELGAEELRMDRRTNLSLRMSFTKKLMEEAISQLRGTKNYRDFIESIDDNEANFLTILSRSTTKLSIKDATIMIVLDELKDLLQTLPIEGICKQMSKFNDLLPLLSKLVEGLVKKAAKLDIDLLGTDVLKKKFDIEDHWIRAYFRYSVHSFHFDIELTDLPFVGVHFFGDAISSIFHSIFFARLRKLMVSDERTWRVHEGPTKGDELIPWRNRKLLAIIYKKTEDLKYHHIAFNLNVDANTITAKKEIEQVGKYLRDLGFISEFRIREPTSRVFH